MHSKNALEALQSVIIAGRSMGYSDSNPQQIASLLDEAEYLVSLILRDEHEEFAEQLNHIGAKFPQFAYIAQHYHQKEALQLQQAA